MRRTLAIGVSAALAAASLTAAALATSSGASPASAAVKVKLPNNPTTRIAGLQHFCGSNGITCADPATTWNELAGYNKAVRPRAHPALHRSRRAVVAVLLEQAGRGQQHHLEPDAAQGSAHPAQAERQRRDVRLPAAPGVLVQHGDVRPQRLAQPGRDTRSSGRAVHAGQRFQHFRQPESAQSEVFRLGPGQAFEEMQFYPPGWVPQPMGVGCSARQWCAALNIDTFQDNENTGGLNNVACLNTVSSEYVNFAFITKNGKATAPANPLSPNSRVPDLTRDFLMNPVTPSPLTCSTRRKAQ